MKKDFIMGLIAGLGFAFIFSYFVITNRNIVNSLLFTVVCLLCVLVENGIKEIYKKKTKK